MGCNSKSGSSHIDTTQSSTKRKHGGNFEYNERQSLWTLKNGSEKIQTLLSLFQSTPRKLSGLKDKDRTFYNKTLKPFAGYFHRTSSPTKRHSWKNGEAASIKTFLIWCFIKQGKGQRASKRVRENRKRSFKRKKGIESGVCNIPLLLAYYSQYTTSQKVGLSSV
jgi:hypothetical protein